VAQELWWHPQLAGGRRLAVSRSGSATAGDGGNVNTGVQVIVQGAASPPARSAYRHLVEQVFPGHLVDRQAELRALAEYCTKKDLPSYLWLQAPAWAGKSALMAAFVLDPPTGVRIVSFFVTARWAGQGDRAAFLEAVLTQLAESAGQPLPDVLTESSRQGWFGKFLESAAAACEQNGTRLVLVIDGLDEDTGVTVGPDAHSVAALLPARPPRGVRVIVAGRPDPPVPSDVPSWHPLRDQAIVRQLSISHRATMARDDAERELARLLSDDLLGKNLLGLMVASGGGLTGADLAELTGRSPWEVGQVLKSVSGRSFTGRSSRWQRSETPIFVLAHEELRQTAVECLGSRAIEVFRDRLHAWADSYRQKQWPSTTPEYLLSDYPRMLHEAGDLPRMQDLAADRARLDRMLDLSGGDAAALAEVVDVLEFTRSQSNPDLNAVLRLAVTRDRLTSRNRGIPPGLLNSWVALGSPSRAEALARSVTNPSEQTANLTALARELVQADDLDTARQVAHQAESAAQLIEGRFERLTSWAALVEVWARTGDLKTTEIARQIRDVVALLTDEYRLAIRQEAARSSNRDYAVTTYTLAPIMVTYDDMMAALAQAQAAAGDFDGALSTARAIDNTFKNSLRSRVLTSLVEAMARAGDLARAEKTAQAIPVGYDQVQALAAVALAFARTPKTLDLARQLLGAAEAAVGAIPRPALQVRALASIAVALAAAGDLNRARNLARLAETVSESMKDEPNKLAVSADLARALIRSEDVERATQLARRARTIVDDLLVSGYGYKPVEAMERMVAVLIETGGFDQAREVARQIEDLVRVEVSPEQELRTRQALAAALVRAGDLEQAKGIVAAFDERVRDRGLIALADVLSEMDDLQQAENVILAVAEPILQARKLAGLAGKWYGRGNANNALAVTDIALTVLDSAIVQGDPDVPLRLIAEVLTQIKDYKRADDVFDRISDWRIRNSLRLRLAEICAGNGNMKRAEAVLRSVDQENELNSPQLASIVAAMVRGGDPDRAVRWAFDLGTREPVTIALAKELAETGDLDRAEWLIDSIASRSGKIEVLTALMESAASAHTAARFQKATVLAESAARSTTDPVKRASSLLACAEALARTGKTQAAESLINEAESIARSIGDQRANRPILRALVRSLLEVHAYDRAAAVALSISDPEHQMEAATMVVDKSDLQASRRLLASILVVADPIPYLDLVAKVEPRAVREAVGYLPL
jgi:tetratricopeptide (TPR) repeat protein